MKHRLLITCLFTILSFCLTAQNTNTGTGAGNSGTDNSSFGAYAGDVVTGSFNSFFGKNAGKSNTSGSYGVFMGSNSGFSNTSGGYNTFIGYYAGYSNTTSTHNVNIGYYSGYSNTGGYNTFLGNYSGRSNSTGSYNTFLGYQAGYSNAGSNNVFIGKQAGYNESGSDKLYIDNSSTSTPLIFGNFSTNQVGINAQPNSSHTLTVGGSVYATSIYVNGTQLIPHFMTSGNDLYYNTGNISIGTNDPKGYKLAVAGKIISEEVVIKLQSSWPDYVFEPTYELRPLAEVEKFLRTNKHLPEVPSALEIKENGLNTGEMNAILLKKVEELTLYIIDLEKRLKEIEK